VDAAELAEEADDSAEVAEVADETGVVDVPLATVGDVVPLEAGAVPVEDAVEVQLTAVGRLVTPEIPQNWMAKLVAAVWSAASHWPARQHAIPLKKPLLEQMHLMSDWEHPPIFAPDVYEFTQL